MAALQGFAFRATFTATTNNPSSRSIVLTGCRGSGHIGQSEVTLLVDDISIAPGTATTLVSADASVPQFVGPFDAAQTLSGQIVCVARVDVALGVFVERSVERSFAETRASIVSDSSSNQASMPAGSGSGTRSVARPDLSVEVSSNALILNLRTDDASNILDPAVIVALSSSGLSLLPRRFEITYAGAAGPSSTEPVASFSVEPPPGATMLRLGAGIHMSAQLNARALSFIESRGTNDLELNVVKIGCQRSDATQRRASSVGGSVSSTSIAAAWSTLYTWHWFSVSESEHLDRSGASLSGAATWSIASPLSFSASTTIPLNLNGASCGQVDVSISVAPSADVSSSLQTGLYFPLDTAVGCLKQTAVQFFHGSTLTVALGPLTSGWVRLDATNGGSKPCFIPSYSTATGQWSVHCTITTGGTLLAKYVRIPNLGAAGNATLLNLAPSCTDALGMIVVAQQYGDPYVGSANDVLQGFGVDGSVGAIWQSLGGKFSALPIPAGADVAGLGAQLVSTIAECIVESGLRVRGEVNPGPASIADALTLLGAVFPAASNGILPTGCLSIAVDANATLDFKNPTKNSASVTLLSQNATACCKQGWGLSLSAPGTCIRCAAGTFGSVTTCAPCTAAPGSYCAALSTTAAGVACPSGSFCSGGSAPAVACTGAGGTYCPASCATNGVPCPSGSSCAGGTSLPVQCSAGSWASSGSATCTPCPVNTFLSTAGATSLSSCQACPTGTASSTASLSCQAAPGGSRCVCARVSVCVCVCVCVCAKILTVRLCEQADSYGSFTHSRSCLALTFGICPCGCLSCARVLRFVLFQ